jgi:hypothetical protein
MIRRMGGAGIVGLVLIGLLAQRVAACSLCGANLLQAPTWRQEAAAPTARIILIGIPRDRGGAAGASDLDITEVVRRDAALGERKSIELSRYVPNDPKNPTRFLVYCYVFKDKIDPFRGIPLKSADAVAYARKVVALDPKDIPGNLAFFFSYLEHPDKELATDAFLEFAKATDVELAKAARRLSADKLREWLDKPETPQERLSMYGLLLGACGRAEDVGFFEKLLDRPSDRIATAYDGLLAGYMHLRPREGWQIALSVLRDSKKPLSMRLGVVRTLTFWHNAQPRESRDNLLRCFAVMLPQADLADLAVEDLRRWEMWDLSKDVVSLYGRKGFDAPLLQQAILRYALTCKDASCRAFIDDRRRSEPDVVRDVEEQLQADK